MRVIKTILFFLMIAFFADEVSAQDTLRLPEAVNMALKNSLDIQLAHNSIEAATILNSNAIAGGVPEVSGTGTVTQQVSSVNQQLSSGSSIKRSNTPASNVGLGISGSILLYNGGRVIATRKRLGELENQSTHRLKGQIQNTIAEVETAYYDVVRQQDYIKTIDRSIEASNQQLSIVKTRQNVGLANNADLWQAQVDLNALLQSKQAQLLVVAQAKSELMRLLTASADSSFTVQDSIMVDSTVSIGQVLDSVPQNADIIAAQDQIRINELIVKETNALRYPSVRAIAGYNFSRNNTGAGNVLLNENYGPQVGLSLDVPIFNGGAYRKQVQVAKIDVQNADIQRRVLLRDDRAAAIKQYEAYIFNLNQLATERNTYLLSQKLLDLTLLRFNYRQATIIEVRDAQQSFEASGYRLVNLSFAAKAAEIEMKRLGNILPAP